MKLNPLDVKKQRFNKSFLGYNKEEVIIFLERLSDELERLQNENSNLKSELDKANKKLEEYQKIEKNLQETLLKAYESTSKAVDAAKKTNCIIEKRSGNTSRKDNRRRKEICRWNKKFSVGIKRGKKFVDCKT